MKIGLLVSESPSRWALDAVEQTSKISEKLNALKMSKIQARDLSTNVIDVKHCRSRTLFV